MDVKLTVGATGGGDYLQYKKWDSPPRPLHSAPEGPPYSRLDTPLVKLPTAPPTMSSDGHEIELSEFQSDRPPIVITIRSVEEEVDLSSMTNPPLIDSKDNTY